jgi:hypothetical protein
MPNCYSRSSVCRCSWMATVLGMRSCSICMIEGARVDRQCSWLCASCDARGGAPRGCFCHLFAAATYIVVVVTLTVPSPQQDR